MKKVVDRDSRRRCHAADFISLVSIACVLCASFPVQAAEVHALPLGFYTIDITPQTWPQLNPDYRFKGKVSDTLKFGDIEDIWVLRCFMHVLNDSHIASTVKNAIPPEAEFLGGAVSGNFWRSKDKALLT